MTQNVDDLESEERNRAQEEGYAPIFIKGAIATIIRRIPDGAINISYGVTSVLISLFVQFLISSIPFASILRTINYISKVRELTANSIPWSN